MSGHAIDPDEVMEADLHRNDMDDIEVEEIRTFNTNGNNEDDSLDTSGTPLPPLHREHEPSMEIIEEDRRVRIMEPAVDLDFMNTNYSGFVLVNRLQFVADRCPPLQKDALILMLEILKKDTMCTNRYSSIYSKLEALYKGEEGIPPIDTQWIEINTQKGQNKMDQLLAEFKKQKDEGVKESTRRAMEELFQHYIQMGSLSEALKLYNRGMREYCSQFRHIMTMYLTWMECAILAGEWPRVEPLISQAERAISDANDAEQVANATSRARIMTQTNKNYKQICDSSRAKIDAITALMRLHNGRYKDAADKFLSVNPDEIINHWILSHHDIAFYGTITALASFERDQLKKRVIGGESGFKKFMESEPSLIELVGQFVKSQFGRCFDIMDKLKNRLLLDPYLSSHVNTLYDMIRERSMIQYLAPFCKADLKAMATAFRCTNEKLEDSLVSLVDKGLLTVRIDSVNGIVTVPPKDDRENAYEKIIKVAEIALEKSSATIQKAVLGQTKVCVQQDGNRGKRRTAANQSNDEGHSNLSGPFRTYRRVRQLFQGSPEADSNNQENIFVPSASDMTIPEAVQADPQEANIPVTEPMN